MVLESLCQNVALQLTKGLLNRGEFGKLLGILSGICVTVGHS